MLITTDRLRKLATDGWKINTQKVQRHLQNNQNDIGEAAHSLLTDWRDTQDNKEIAFNNICEALHRVKMPHFVSDLKSMPSK